MLPWLENIQLVFRNCKVSSIHGKNLHLTTFCRQFNLYFDEQTYYLFSLLAQLPNGVLPAVGECVMIKLSRLSQTPFAPGVIVLHRRTSRTTHKLPAQQSFIFIFCKLSCQFNTLSHLLLCDSESAARREGILSFLLCDCNVCCLNGGNSKKIKTYNFVLLLHIFIYTVVGVNI